MSAFVRAALVCLLLSLIAGAQAPAVKVWEESVVIPTYVPGPPDPNPFFYTGRTYQGAKGLIFPYPLYDNLTDVKQDKSYKQVCLENEYVKICVLPELGGRIFEAVDKTNGYNFFYKQSVIKPALIGMLGAWISGGVEWNIPHHHRASSFLPVLYKTEESGDGSKTIWVGEHELRDRMRWAIGLTLRPGSSVLEAKVTALNTTPLSNSILYFANVAVHTNNDYQVIFPPSTQFATQHAKREFSRWPISREVYNGIDFSKGVDVSMWKNHPSPISMFAWNYEDDFLAGYDFGKQAGTLHVADHHQVPGKKFFAWGTGPTGKMWDNILSDTDGPYLELMVGAWSDNQPDYSWLQPYEAKSVKQYWYPFRTIGGVKNANLDAAVNLEVKDGRVKVGFYTTKARPASRAVVFAGGKEVWSKPADLDPAHPLQDEFALPAGVKATDLRAVLDAGGRELISYQPKELPKLDLPKPVEPPEVPAKMKTAEELTLAGQRLEQLHNPSLEPDPYYEEALKRDPNDSRANVNLGILYIKRARYADAEKLLQRATDRVSFNYTRPKDCEPLYYLGLAQKLQEKYAHAEDSMQRAAWCAAWQAPAYFQLAELAMLRGKIDESLALVDRSLVTNAWNTRALALKAVLLQKSGRGAEAALVRKQLSLVDPIDPKGYSDPMTFNGAIAAFPQEGIETATNLIEAGLWNEAAALLEQMKNGGPMTAYFRGWIAQKQGQPEVAKTWFRKASAMPFRLVFPFRREVEAALRAAMKADEKDPMPPYYLGLFLFDRQPEQAMAMWRKTAELNPKMATAWRNLAVGYGRTDDGTTQAIAALEKAIAANPEDASYLFELDKQYEWAQVAPEKRLALFQDRMAVTEKRDDAMARYVSALVLAGENDKAIDIMKKRHFHLWEGGVRFGVSDAWTDAHILRGQKELSAKQNDAALKDFLTAIEYPANLEATRAYRGSRAPEVFYWTGRVYEAMGDKEKAKQAWKESAAELVGSEDNPEPTVNSGASLLYYRALSLEKLGEKAHAKAVFESLVKAGRDALKPAQGADFFAKFGERQSKQMSDSMAHYVSGLGYLGLGQSAKARVELEESVKLNKYLVGARATLASMKP